nr:N-myristoyltransferase [Cryptomonas sp.]
MNTTKKLNLTKIKKTSPLLPFEIEWIDLNIAKSDKLNEVFSILDLNYIEDNECTFRFHYVHEFLALALKAPGWSSFLNLGLRYRRCRKLVGIISSVPKQIIFDKNIFCAPDINFLCFNKQIRNRRFVYVIIEEITRRLNLTGILQAVYTSGVSFPNSMFSYYYYHYPINNHKLIAFKFIKKLPCHKKIDSEKKENFKISEKPTKYAYIGIRKNFINLKTYRCYKLKDFFYWFRSIPGVLYMIFFEAIESSMKNQIFTFYSLPSKYIKNEKKNFLYGIYLYYKSSSILNNRLFTYGIDIIRKNGFDVINVLDSEKNKAKLSTMTFIKGTGKLNFYIFNWTYRNICLEENGLAFF